jgi:glyoxylase I family protein
MNMKTEYIGLHHGSLIVQDLDISLDFYCQILGMSINPDRPDLGFKGAWLNLGEQQIHLLNLPEAEPFGGHYERPEHAGRDRHLAIYVRHIDLLKESLTKHKIAFTMSRSGRNALFCRDPDGNGLEFIEVN